METIDLGEYNVDIQREENTNFDDLICHIQEIIMDRSIPEEQKLDVKKQLDEVFRLKSITMDPSKIVLTPKD